jgi:putative methyltransferase (TIGR04325 family)|tara:strand:- start:1959 stop:2729 length:771 start_codon:yes stop_codon:yes gene_type:complete
MTQKINVWEGVYSSWEEAPGDDDVFDGTVWIGKVTDRAQKAVAAYRSSESVSLATLNKDYILSVAGGMLLSSLEDDLRVLDFGGSMAASYFPLIASMPDPDKVEFHIVEGKIICERGKEVLSDFPKLHFHQQLPQLPQPVHIVHAGSSIQYVLDWKGLLAEFTNYRPRLLILEDLMAGDIPSFITTQAYYGKKIRSWFLNINEIIEAVQDLGYQLTYKSRYTHEIMGEVGPLPMENFSPEYRLNYGSHLMFERIES